MSRSRVSAAATADPRVAGIRSDPSISGEVASVQAARSGAATPDGPSESGWSVLFKTVMAFLVLPALAMYAVGRYLG
jgi:hypothetical protein